MSDSLQLFPSQVSRCLSSVPTLSPTFSLFFLLTGKFNEQVDAGICGDAVRRYDHNGFSRLNEKEITRERSARDSTIAGAVKTGYTSSVVSQGPHCAASCVKVKPACKENHTGLGL